MYVHMYKLTYVGTYCTYVYAVNVHVRTYVCLKAKSVIWIFVGWKVSSICEVYVRTYVHM